MTTQKITHCPNCGSKWNEEEKLLQECYECNYPDIEEQKQPAAAKEWDDDDDEAMPNVISR